MIYQISYTVPISGRSDTIYVESDTKVSVTKATKFLREDGLKGLRLNVNVTPIKTVNARYFHMLTRR